MDYSDLPPDCAALSYDDTLPYEEQVPIHSEPSLSNRIGSTKIYLLSESSIARVGKRKHEQEEDDNGHNVEMDEDISYRPNALLFRGSPISQLPTARIFAYATHFDTHPMGLEWVDDTTCVLVFESKTEARLAYRHLQKSAVEDPDDSGFVTAKPIPVAFWPPEERINKSLGKGEGLKGTMRMRWATGEDVKKKGAKQESEFYKKHGTDAGKEIRRGGPKRRRRDAQEDEMEEKAKLDNELDEFLAEDSVDEPPSPPSKMRSDYIASDGKTLLERTSDIRTHGTHVSFASRIMAPLPRRSRGDSNKWMRGDVIEQGREKGRRRTTERPRKSQQELDDELDSFLNDRD